MSLRNLIMLASAAALLALGPASAQTLGGSNKAATEKTQVQKKPVKNAQKKNTKKVAKKSDKKGKKEVAKAEPARKPGLFATLFGGPVKDKSEKPVKVDPKTKKAAASLAKRQPALPPAQAEEEVTAASLNDNRPVELRSDVKREPTLLGALFGASQVRMLPETERRDRYLRQTEAKKGVKKFVPKEELMPRVVEFSNNYKRGTIVVNTAERRLYLVESGGKARRYAIAVGREGLEFKGTGKVGDKQEWPRWIPTLDMQKREPKKYGQYKDGMDGGPENPLGARAIYLYQGKKDTHIRIHGTTQPWTIGTNSSNGCFRMINEHVMDLYGRVSMGADIVVL